MKKMISLTAALLLGSAAFAQEEGLHLSAGLMTAQGNAVTLTRKVWGGYTFEAGYLKTPEGYGFSVMPYAGWGKMPGKQNIPDRDANSVWGPNTYDLTNWHAGVDFRVPVSKRFPLTLAFGPSFHLWQVERVGVISKPMVDQRDIKLGARVGLEYQFCYSESVKRFSVGLFYTATEYHSQRDVSTWPGYKSDTGSTPSYIDGLNPCRPAYFTLRFSAKY